MLTLPAPIVPILDAFATLFRSRVFQRVRLLIVGAILTPGSRTIAAVLRTLGLDQDVHFQNWHRVLNRDVWSARKAAGILLRLIVSTFVPEGPIVIAGDETLERRRGAKIKCKALWHDPVRSSKSIPVFSHGLRWLVFAVLAPIPWAKQASGLSQPWALPFFCALLTSPKYDEKQQRRHKPLHRVTIQMLAQVKRWLPNRKIVFVGDGSYSVMDLLRWCGRKGVTLVTRLRLDACLYGPPASRKPGQKGRPPTVGARLPKLSQVLADPTTVWTETLIPNWYGGKARRVETCTGTALWKKNGEEPVEIRWVLVRDPEHPWAPHASFEPLSLLCTDRDATPEQIIGWFVGRWQIENTFRESRAHLGIETQRQWSDLAIARTTPVLFGLYSLITLMAHTLQGQSLQGQSLQGQSLQGQSLQGQPAAESPSLTEQAQDCVVRECAWYRKEHPTFADALALVRRHLWQGRMEALCEDELRTHFDGDPIIRMSMREHDIQKYQTKIIRLLTETLAYAT